MVIRKMLRGAVPMLLFMAVLLPAHAQTGSSRYFPETKHTVKGRFLEYWEQNGGLEVFGYPLTDEQLETNSSGDRVTTQ